MRRERTEPDDLFCEEKMLIIDGKSFSFILVFLNFFIEKQFHCNFMPFVRDRHFLDFISCNIQCYGFLRNSKN